MSCLKQPPKGQTKTMHSLNPKEDGVVDKPHPQFKVQNGPPYPTERL